MKAYKPLLDFEKLVNLFFTFVIGTTSFVVLVFFNIPNHPFWAGIRFALLLTGIFSYEVVLVALFSYYASKAKKKVAVAFEKNPQLYYWLTVSLLAGTYLFLNTIVEKSWLIFFRDVVMVGLILIGLPKINKYFKKKKNGKE